MSSDIKSAQTVTPDLVKEQLRRLQSSSLFSHSRRYPSFLNYVVSKTLEGFQDELKERTIGIEAFGRPAGYDLNADPIVRVTAGEVRKRLAQYYYEPEHQGELRIELRSGSYVPEFKAVPEKGFYTATEPPTPEVLTPPTHSELGIESKEREDGRPRLNQTALFASGGVVALIVSALLALTHVTPSDRFWQPIIDSPNPVLILVGSVVVLEKQPLSTERATSVGGHPLSSDPVALADTIAISKIQQVLFRHTKASSIQSSTATTFSDLQKGPVVLISGFNNPWTMRLTDPLRFHFVHTDSDDYEIEDRTDPTHKRWTIHTLTPFTKINCDFALVARFHDPVTEQMIVVAAGIGENGTIAASELLSNEKYLSTFRRDGLLPARSQNWEAVIETETIDGKPGPPRILATYSW